MYRVAMTADREPTRAHRANLRLRAMTVADAAAVLAIYREGIATGHATFEESLPAWADWHRTHLTACRLIAEGDDGLAGWAALSTVSARPVYRGVAEVSVYIAAAARGRGVGRALLSALVQASEQAGIWTLQAGAFPENRASLELHRSLGFRVVGTRNRIGLMTYGPCAGQWRDVVLMERRSPQSSATWRKGTKPDPA